MRSDVHLQLLEQIRIASPCTADWNTMQGDDRMRHCQECDLNVYNLSAMTEDEATAFVRNAKTTIGKGGRVCARLYRRADGTVLTQDCPVGLAAARAKVRRTICRIAAAVFALLSIGAGAQWRTSAHVDGFVGSDSMEELTGVNRFAGWLNPDRFQRQQVMPLMGAIAFPSTPSNAKSQSCDDDTATECESGTMPDDSSSG